MLPGATELRIGGNANIKISGKDQRMTITTTDGSSVGLGTIPGDAGNLGFFSLNATGQVIQKIILGTWYVNKPTTAENFLQSGILPDGTGGFVITKDGSSVASVFS